MGYVYSFSYTRCYSARYSAVVRPPVVLDARVSSISALSCFSTSSCESPSASAIVERFLPTVLERTLKQFRCACVILFNRMLCIAAFSISWCLLFYVVRGVASAWIFVNSCVRPKVFAFVGAFSVGGGNGIATFVLSTKIGFNI